MKLQNIYTEAMHVGDAKFNDHLKALLYIQKTHPDPNKVVVTYTKLNKVGINPLNSYNTPLGIYFYPLRYVTAMAGEVPFAGDREHINVCELVDVDKILHMTPFDGKHDGLDLLRSAFPNTDEAIKFVERKIRIDQYEIRSNYSMLWLASMVIAKEPTKWNTIFRRLGIIGFIDHGTKTIHPSEPTQGVVFQGNAIKVLHVFQRSEHLRGIDLRKKPLEIAYIKNPTERQQLTAIKSDPQAIKYIIEPTPLAQRMAVSKINSLIWSITNPAFDVIMMVIRKDYNIIKYFEPDRVIQVLENLEDYEYEQIDVYTFRDIILNFSQNESNTRELGKIMRIFSQKGIDCSKLENTMILRILISAVAFEEVVYLLGVDAINKLTDSQIWTLFDENWRAQPVFEKYFPEKVKRYMELEQKRLKDANLKSLS